MSSTDRQNNLLIAENWQKIYQSFKNANFQSYDFDNLRRTMIDYIRTNFPEDFNDYIESSEYLALIDLIAYVGQSIAFRVDLNARENFLELAERRDSILRLARVIGYNASRNIAANGLLKFNTVSTTENVVDSNGRNLAGQYITWNDPSNANWYDQFIKVINAALPRTNQFGNPLDSATIYGVSTAQYRFNASNTNVPIYNFNKTVSGRNMNFEITSTTFSGKNYIYEEAPKIGNKIACIYKDDGYGASSPGTGFFFNFTQGTMNTGGFTVNQPSSNQQIDIPTQNINNTDVWLYSLDQSTGLETKLWTQVPATTGSNVIYNSLSADIKNIYSVVTRAGDAISLSFSDGIFGTLPQGNFRVYYRVSNGLNYTVNPADIVNIVVSIPYVSAANTAEVLTVSLSLVTSVTNAATTETNASVKTNAPQTYYTQNRMITGEDYNISPLSANLNVAKVQAINRTSSGISRYFDLTDPTGKYSKTTLFADDGILYRETYNASINFTYVTQTDIQGVIYNTIYDILNTPNLRNFYYANYLDFLDVSLNIQWNAVTTDSNTSSGYISLVSSVAGSTNIPLKVGSFTATDLKYLTAGAIIRFTAPPGYYFDTDGNVLSAGTATVPGSTSYIWAEVVSVADDGTANNTGVMPLTGQGPIVLNKPIPSLAVATQIIPQFVTTISSTVVTTMIDLIFANDSFGLRYDATTQSWQIIFANNLNVASPFTLGNQGNASNLQLDSSWMLLFTTNTERYTVTSRNLRYVFESRNEVTFYFDSNTTIYDKTSSSTVSDTIKVLSINTRPDQLIPFTQDLTWQIVSEYVGKDGYIDPKKLVITFADASGNGIVDNPQLFLDIVNPATNPLEKYIVQQKYTISDGQEDYRYLPNNPSTGPVLIFASQTAAGSLTQYADGTYFYFADTAIVFRLTLSTGRLEPTLDYQIYTGRDNLKFQYIHRADHNSRIDPGASNIIDIYVLTSDYDALFRQWVTGGAIGNAPLPPSSDQLNTLLSANLNLIKSISDEIIYHPVNYTLLFGPQASPNLQANFNAMINPNSAVSAADVQSRILNSINIFFALENWNFGDTFYFTELSTYVMNKLSPDLISFVIVPSQPDLYFGNLFEIHCSTDNIFLSCAAANNIIIVSGLTGTNLKTISAPPTNSLTNNQSVTTAPYSGK
jgi:hypothetical protein